MVMATSAISKIQSKIWAGVIPLEIHLSSADCRTYDGGDVYLVNIPRLSYLPLLLPRLHAYFRDVLIQPEVSVAEAWFEYQDVALKWHYPVGLLFDLFSGAMPASADGDGEDDVDGGEGDIGVEDGVGNGEDGEGGQAGEKGIRPWRLTLHFSGLETEKVIRMDEGGRVCRDGFVNGVKEADVIRNGKGNVFMGLSKNDSDALWESVQTHNLTKFNTINNKLLNAPGVTLRSIPMKIYLPTVPEEGAQKGSIRTVQSLVSPLTSSRQQTTLGISLNTILPTVFPSRRNPVLATPVLHGAIVPMNAPVEELMRAAAYADGFLHIAVVML